MKMSALSALVLLLALPTTMAFAQRGGNANADHDEMMAKLGMTPSRRKISAFQGSTGSNTSRVPRPRNSPARPLASRPSMHPAAAMATRRLRRALIKAAADAEPRSMEP